MFSKILIANRGAIAVRIARTCERMGIGTVAVFSDADQGAPHVAACGEAARIGEAPVSKSYLNASAIIEAAKQHRVQAIHPGYGLLSEKAEFARAAAAAGLVFVGPEPETLEKLGDKLRAREIARAAGVAAVPGSEAAVSGAVAAKEQAAHLGYPVVVKAAAGGGGIGMQVVADETQLERAMQSCADRGASAFGDNRIYIERCLSRPRHVEVQLLADGFGHCVALGDRECSLQRRHQKILEESPAPAFANIPHNRMTREELCDAAVKIAKHSAYRNAGTCEFLADADGSVYFLEFNARLQVEHGVTEFCTGIDLVEMQLRIAAGEPLPQSVKQARASGHSIEARIYAEDPQRGFLPKPGRVQVLRWPIDTPGKLRIDSSVTSGSDVTPYYDPLVAKVITYGQTRHEALLTLDRVLAQTVITPLTTNISFLRDVLGDEAFRAGQYDTTTVARLVATAS
ncbi:MAG: ATP-grasp domain-containing protein [Proteobacteria bacterium]|nr:ATP-grasp domain-containing protein [Pseudomonadota bacterium]